MEKAQPDLKILVQMTITVFTNGQVTLKGIPDSDIMAYGMLEKAREMIYDLRKSQREDRRIEVPKLEVN